MESVIKTVRGIRARANLAILVTGVALLLFGDAASITHSRSMLWQSFRTNTWSIVAADPVSGDVGVAMASCVPDTHGDAVGALAPGKGVAAIQAVWDLDNRNQIFDMLQAGDSANIIIDRMSDAQYDAGVNDRQYGIVTLHDGEVDIAAFSGASIPAWSGSQQDTALGVTVQGNTLVSEEVVADAMTAFKTGEPGFNTLPDRLMRALEAGSAAGGDSRCNNEQVTQTAATAFILVARGGDEPYATENIGSTDAGTPAAPWLALSVAESKFGPNPIIELRRQYDEWRLENLEDSEDQAEDRINILVLVVVVLATALVVLGAIWISRRRVNTTS